MPARGALWPSAGALRRVASCRAASSSAPSRPFTVYYADWARVDLPEGHRFPMDKYAYARAALDADAQLRGKILLRESPRVNMEDLLATHCPEYVRRVITRTLSEKEIRAIGFPMAEQNVLRSLASTGGTVACAREVLTQGARAAAQMAGGTHHAYRDRGEGFCVFNDIAVAIRVAQRDHADKLQGRKILVIDLDVHQGNGTAKIFENDPQVVTFSMHGANNYPIKTREKSTHDVELPDDADDEMFLEQLALWLPRLFDDYDPAIVFFQAGVDALREDSFGRLGLTRNGLLRRNNAVYSMCITRGVPLVITMGGGYSKPINASVDAHVDVFRSAALRFTAP